MPLSRHLRVSSKTIASGYAMFKKVMILQNALILNKYYQRLSMISWLIPLKSSYFHHMPKKLQLHSKILTAISVLTFRLFTLPLSLSMVTCLASGVHMRMMAPEYRQGFIKNSSPKLFEIRIVGLSNTVKKLLFQPARAK